ncbi:MAG: hypothetical protein AAGD11_09965 [Planctomycetota bacterium]
MRRRFSKIMLSAALALAGSFSVVNAEEPLLETTLSELSDPWASDYSDITYETHELSESDETVTPVQMLAPQRALGNTRMAQRPRRSAVARRNPNLASVPFMIGDTGAGSCVALGNILDVELAHPTMACSRLNISESNTPLPTDRLFYSFRHFQNATPVRVFQFTESFDVNRHTLGGERTFFDKMMSVELRVPIEERLNSTTLSYAVNADTVGPFAPGFDAIGGFGEPDTQVELGNMSLIFKALLIERENFALSAGLGVGLPTAQDVTYAVLIDDFVTFDQTPFLARYNINFGVVAENETIYLSPFLAWVWQMSKRSFHQGFLQVETPANDSRLLAGGFGLTTFDTNLDGSVNALAPDPGDEFIQFTDLLPIGRTEIQAQTLLRLNLGFGHVLRDNPTADWIQKLTGIFELHYTTTLNDANINDVPLFVQATTFTGVGFDSISVGNPNNRIDILNAVCGLSANVGNWVVTNGVTAPIRSGTNRGFDFEYNLQVQRPF